MNRFQIHINISYNYPSTHLFPFGCVFAFSILKAPGIDHQLCQADAASLGHRYVIISAGAVLKLIDVCLPGSFMPKPRCGEEDLNRCAIGIKFNGSLTDPRLRPLLVDLLLDLRGHFPDAKILAMDEYDRWHIKVREDMNELRRELSGYN